MAVIGTELTDSLAAMDLAAKHEGLVAAAGCHPHNASELRENDKASFCELARQEKVAAIGEIGLDFYRNLSPKDDQIASFRFFLSLAMKERMPVIIHSRDAEEETCAILTSWKDEVRGEWPAGLPLGVMHCFGGDLELALKYIDMGFLISIPGTVTYPRSDRMRQVARGIPASAMVVETDAPYLPPQRHRGRRNEPSYLTETVARIADIRGESFQDVARTVTGNAQRLFGLVKKV